MKERTSAKSINEFSVRKGRERERRRNKKEKMLRREPGLEYRK